MEIAFEDSKLEKLIGNRAKAYRKYGAKAIEALYLRLSNIQSAVSVAELSLLPGGFHKLKHDLSGLWACSLTGVLRLVMRVEEERVVIISITNYHKGK